MDGDGASAICAYTSAEGRKCRNKTQGAKTEYCRHHKCPGCSERPKPSRAFACQPCVTRAPPKPAGGAGGRPSAHDKAVLLAKAEATVPPSKHVRAILESFGVSGAGAAAAGGGDLAQKFNYAEMKLSAEDVFRMYDADGSGSIDADELRGVLFACGVTCKGDSFQMAKRLLKLDKPGATCNFATFDKWWKATYAKSRAARSTMLEKLGKEIAEFLIPELKSLYAEFDADCSGALDKAEFEKFYPRLKDFLGYPIPPLAECLAEMDSQRTAKAEAFEDGEVSYDEFETWFLHQEQKRIQAATAGGAAAAT
mmetsp:Transcript_8479/g.21733  ORF Transcript_8479/g.21733 Transcript_8479/m.21733 type:complete len:310 (+) Transcript_8479:100-1029(+)